jgi:hypothetical protein
MLPSKNNGLIHPKNMSRTWALHAEHMISVSSRYLENSRSLHNTILLNHAPCKNNGLIHRKNMSRTSTLYAGFMFKVPSQYLKNCRSSSRHKILLNRAPLQKVMDLSTGEICHAHLHFMSDICLKFQVNTFVC